MNYWIERNKRQSFIDRFEEILQLATKDLTAIVDINNERNISHNFWRLALEYSHAFPDHYLKIDTRDYKPLMNAHVGLLTGSVLCQLEDYLG